MTSYGLLQTNQGLSQENITCQITIPQQIIRPSPGLGSGLGSCMWA